MAGMKRKDDKRTVLKVGESQRANGSYDYRWTDSKGKRHTIYAKTLVELREKEKGLARDKYDGIKSEARYTTVNEVYDLWRTLKRGLKENTYSTYTYMYETFVWPTFGKLKVSKVKKSDVKRFYNQLADERNLKVSTIDHIHTVLHQVLTVAVDDNYLRNNPADGALKELRMAHGMDIEKRKALTSSQQELFLNYLRNHPIYQHWYPIFAVMIGTGLRVGEVTGLRWQDIDFEKGLIDVNHTLVYYAHRREGGKQGCYFNINTPKTKASNRTVPMFDFVKEAFLMEKQFQEKQGVKCNVVIDGYTDFVFINRFGNVQNQGTLNDAIKRIVRDCNDEILLKNEMPEVLLPPFSCHILRHTFTTRMCEAGINVKVVQDVLGHTDVSTTLNIYANVTEEFKKQEFAGFGKAFPGATEGAVAI